MKKFGLILIPLMLFYSGFAQLNDENTFTDISMAKAYANKMDIPILMVFAGSDWCKPCIQFKKSILLSESFNEYASKNLAILYLDFPAKKVNKLSAEQTVHNEKLADTYNPSGAFPAILMIDAHEKLLGKLSFANQSPEEFIATCQSLSI